MGDSVGGYGTQLGTLKCIALGGWGAGVEVVQIKLSIYEEIATLTVQQICNKTSYALDLILPHYIICDFSFFLWE